MEDRDKKTLAVDIVEGRVFGTWSIGENDINIIPVIFMPLALADKKVLQRMEDDNISQIYEYMDKAGPRGVNGYPTFFSMHSINDDDWKEVRDICLVYKKQKDEFIGDSDETSEV